MKSLKKQINNILNIYTILAIGVIIIGAILDNDFLILLGAIVAVLARTFINNIRTKHITEILKQNNLWTDEIFEKKNSPQTKLNLSEYDKAINLTKEVLANGDIPNAQAKNKDGFD
jgi:hypothetical protein